MASGTHDKRSALPHVTLLTTDLVDVQRGGQPQAGQLGTGSVIGTGGIYATQAAARTAFGLGTAAVQDAATFAGLVTERTLAVPAPGNVDFIIFTAARGYTVNSITAYTRSGTATGVLKIGSTGVTGPSNVSITATPQTVACTAANSMVATDTLKLTISSGSTPLDLHVTVKLTTV